MPTSPDPEYVVSQQLAAYNRHDVDALLAVYADDAEMYEHPNTLLARETPMESCRLFTFWSCSSHFFP
jgi:hypothetical protein